MTQCQIPRSTSVTDVLVDCDTHVLTIIQTAPNGKESQQSIDLSCILPVTSKVTDVFYDCAAEQLIITQVTDGVCAGGECTETFVVSLACILEHTMPACDDLNSVSPLPTGSEIVICTPDGPKTTPPSALLPEFDCSNLPTACCPRPPEALFFACNNGEMVLVPPIDLLVCEDFEFANPIPTDISVIACGGNGGTLVKIPASNLLNCDEFPYLDLPGADTLLVACTPNGLVKIDRAQDGGGGIGEAPIDGTPYERQDAAWVNAGTTGISADAGNIIVPGTDSKLYADALQQDEVLPGNNIGVSQNADGTVTINAEFPVALKAHWHYDDVIGVTEPPVGYMHVNTTDLDTATSLIVNNVDFNGNTIGAGISLIKPGDLLILQDDSKDVLAVYEVTLAAIDNITYYEIPVLYHGGASVNPDQEDLMKFTWFPSSISQDLVEEAPMDGTPYERQDGQWVSAGEFRVIMQELKPDENLYEDGDQWWRTSDGIQFTLFVDDDSRQWVAQSGISGEAGPVGPVGPEGPAGADGAQGPMGVNRFTVVPKTGSFSATKTDGENVLYDMADGSDVTVPTATSGGFSIGDVITLSCATINASITGTGVTFRTPIAKVNSPFGAGAVIGLVYLSDTIVQIYGDLADA